MTDFPGEAPRNVFRRIPLSFARTTRAHGLPRVPNIDVELVHGIENVMTFELVSFGFADIYHGGGLVLIYFNEIRQA